MRPYLSRKLIGILLVSILVLLPGIASQAVGTPTPPTPIPPTITPTPIPLKLNVGGLISSGTSGLKLPTGLAVTLHLLRPTVNNANVMQDVARFQAISDASARYQFQNINAQSGDQFFVSVFYEEVQQASNIFLLTDDSKPVEVDLLVFGTTNDIGALSLIRARHILTPGSGNLIQVLSSYLFRNSGDRLFISKNRTKANQPISVSIALPIGALGIAFDETGRFEVGGTAAAPLVQDTRAVIPGQVHEVVISYQLPYQKGATIDQDYPFDTETVEILIPVDSNVRLTAPLVGGVSVNTPHPATFAEAQNTTLNKQRPYNEYVLKTPIKAGERLIFTLEGGVPTTPTPVKPGAAKPQPQESGAPLALLLVTIAAAGFLVAGAMVVRRAIKRNA